MALVNAFRWAAAGRMLMSRPFGTVESDRPFTAYARGPLWPTLQLLTPEIRHQVVDLHVSPIRRLPKFVGFSWHII